MCLSVEHHVGAGIERTKHYLVPNHIQIESFYKDMQNI